MYPMGDIVNFHKPESGGKSALVNNSDIVFCSDYLTKITARYLNEFLFIQMDERQRIELESAFTKIFLDLQPAHLAESAEKLR